jgi:hypothetical protein
MHARVMREIINPTIAGMAKDGIVFTGFLYAGLMIDAAGNPRTLEFNCRMGDPETQPIMSRLKTDLVTVMEHAVNNPVFGVDMSRVALHAWAEALRDPEIAERIEHKLRRLREHYEEVARRWQTAGLIDADADPENVGSVLLGIVHAFALQRLLIPGTDPAQYLAGVRGLLAARAATITDSSSNQLPGRA